MSDLPSLRNRKRIYKLYHSNNDHFICRRYTLKLEDGSEKGLILIYRKEDGSINYYNYNLVEKKIDKNSEPIISKKELIELNMIHETENSPSHKSVYESLETNMGLMFYKTLALIEEETDKKSKNIAICSSTYGEEMDLEEIMFSGTPKYPFHLKNLETCILEKSQYLVDNPNSFVNVLISHNRHISNWLFFKKVENVENGDRYDFLQADSSGFHIYNEKTSTAIVDAIKMVPGCENTTKEDLKPKQEEAKHYLYGNPPQGMNAGVCAILAAELYVEFNKRKAIEDIKNQKLEILLSATSRATEICVSASEKVVTSKSTKVVFEPNVKKLEESEECPPGYIEIYMNKDKPFKRFALNPELGKVNAVQTEYIINELGLPKKIPPDKKLFYINPGRPYNENESKRVLEEINNNVRLSVHAASKKSIKSELRKNSRLTNPPQPRYIFAQFGVKPVTQKQGEIPGEAPPQISPTPTTKARPKSKLPSLYNP